MLICDNLSISYNEKLLFSNFSVSLYPTTILFIRGANGSGKTTLLKILATLLKPLYGKILLDGRDVMNNIFVYRNNINYIGHNRSIKDSLSVLENIEFWTKIHNSQELISTAIHYFQLSDHIDTKLEYLSAGIKQKTELTKLITKQSLIWFLDEPENNLDSKGRELLINLIVTKAAQGGIIIIASHNNYYIKDSIEIDLNDYAKL